MLRLILLISSLLALTACNTIKGFGKDMQAAGKKLDQIDESEY